jgi:hypothetical protein
MSEAEREKRGRWARGSSGNPNGKPRGSRNRVSIILEKILADDGKEVAEAVVKAAKDGDMTAARLVLDRLIPAPKGRRVQLDLPSIDTPKDILAALSAVAHSMGKGEITPDEASQIASVIEFRRKAAETVELEARVAEIEKRQEGRK